MHRVEIEPRLAARLKAERGGKLHLHERLDGPRTAHVVIDLQNGFMEPGAPAEAPVAREIVPNVNAISEAVREAGGINIFVQFTTPPFEDWSSFYSRFPAEHRQAHREAFVADTHYWQLWSGLDIRDEDLIVEKGRFAAFIPGTSNLHDVLQSRGIDTLIITGTVTNVCCESTARDAMQLNYEVLFVSDGTAAFSDAEHNGTLNSLCALFADVMPTEDVVALPHGSNAAPTSVEALAT